MTRTKGAKDKQPRKSKPTGERRGITKEPTYPAGYCADTTRFLMEITPLEPIDLNDVAEMERRFQHYLEKCIEYDKKPANMAAYMALGLTKDQARDFAFVNTKMNPERSSFLKKVINFCSSFREDLMVNGKVNPVVGIFWQKNYDGLKDQQEVVVTPNNPMGEQKSAEELGQKYLEQTYGVTESLPDHGEVVDVVHREIEKIPEKVAESTSAEDLK